MNVVLSNVEDIQGVLLEKFPTHPFSNKVNVSNVRSTLENYLAMSQLFPFLQAGAQKERAFDAINFNREITEADEITAVIGNFLTWDETGGHYTLMSQGMTGLPNILNTSRNFHANLLKKDLYQLFDQEIKPDYSPCTGIYLKYLYIGLSNSDPITRCACMVAFELHAGRMIEELWASITSIFDIKNKDDLIYFKVHVGGDDPAEAYHMEMTQKMIERLVPNEKEGLFMEQLEKAYELNFNWCNSITYN